MVIAKVLPCFTLAASDVPVDIHCCHNGLGRGLGLEQCSWRIWLHHNIFRSVLNQLVQASYHITLYGETKADLKVSEQIILKCCSFHEDLLYNHTVLPDETVQHIFQRYFRGEWQFKWVTWPYHAPFRDSLSSVGWDYLRSSCVPNLKYIHSLTIKIWEATKNVEIGGVTSHSRWSAT